MKNSRRIHKKLTHLTKKGSRTRMSSTRKIRLRKIKGVPNEKTSFTKMEVTAE